jgi:polysaccharide biosynthesis/export protein
MVNEFMHKSPAKLILFCLCLQGLTLVPAFAQAVVPADGRVGVPINAPIPSTTGAAAAAIPSAAPTNVTSYVLGPEDQITVRIFAAADIPDKPVQIDNNGTVTLPMIGQVRAAGLTVGQLQANLVTAYKKYFKDPQVTVQVNDFRSQPVSVAGNVAKPGVVQLAGNRNLIEVIGQAGGLLADAGDSVLITRNLSEGPIPVAGAFTDPTGKYSVAHINVRSIMNGKDPEANIQIKPHDVITVPRARLIYVLGNVGRPGGYVLTENETMSLTQAIALAGGWDKMAALGSARILRADGGPTREQIPANVKKIMENKAPDLQMQPDDILYIPNSMTKVIGAQGIESAIGIGTGLLVSR